MPELSAEPAIPATLRLDQIDALRGLAAIMVVMHHAWIHAGSYAWPAINSSSRPWVFSHIYAYGYIGVDLFLVLSGFCLAWPYFKSQQRPFEWRRYIYRRFWRIYPPYFIVFVALFAAGWMLRRIDSNRELKLTNWTPATVVGGLLLQKTVFNESFWTLVLEARWYAIFPFVVIFARRFSTWPLLLIACVVCVVEPLDTRGPGKLLTYLPVFIAGVWAAEIHSRPNSRAHRIVHRMAPVLILGALSISYWRMPALEVTGRFSYPEAFLSGTLFFGLLIMAIRYDRPIPGWLRWLRSVGLFSYTLYLVHEPVIVCLYRWSPIRSWQAPAQFFFWQVLMVPLLVVVAWGLFQLIERPFLYPHASHRGRAIAATPQHAAP